MAKRKNKAAIKRPAKSEVSNTGERIREKNQPQRVWMEALTHQPALARHLDAACMAYGLGDSAGVLQAVHALCKACWGDVIPLKHLADKALDEMVDSVRLKVKNFDERRRGKKARDVRIANSKARKNWVCDKFKELKGRSPKLKKKTIAKQIVSLARQSQQHGGLDTELSIAFIERNTRQAKKSARLT
jgi:hypothetical protein